MKLRRKLILMMMIGTTISSCSTKYINTHEDLEKPEYAELEKFTKKEKDFIKNGMPSIGKRIKRNNKSCEYRVDAIGDIITSHNKEHSK